MHPIQRSDVGSGVVEDEVQWPLLAQPRYHVADRRRRVQCAEAPLETVRPCVTQELLELRQPDVAGQQRDAPRHDRFHEAADTDVVENGAYRAPYRSAGRFIRIVEQVVDDVVRQQIRGEVALRITVDQEYGPPRFRQRECNVGCQCRLADTALVAEQRYSSGSGHLDSLLVAASTVAVICSGLLSRASRARLRDELSRHRTVGKRLDVLFTVRGQLPLTASRGGQETGSNRVI